MLTDTQTTTLLNNWVDSDYVLCVCDHLGCEHSGSFMDSCNFCDDEACAMFLPDSQDLLDQLRTVFEDAREVATSLTLEDAVSIVGEPAPDWKARCFEIASKLADTLGGIAVYGHWRGPVHPTSLFASTHSMTGFTQHGWVRMPDGSVVDPTRWAFEQADPYIFHGSSEWYDEGGNQARMQRIADAPPCTGEVVPVFTDSALLRVETLLGDQAGTSMPRIIWLANLDPALFDVDASSVFEQLSAAGFKAFIPCDNWKLVVGSPATK